MTTEDQQQGVGLQIQHMECIIRIMPKGDPNNCNPLTEEVITICKFLAEQAKTKAIAVLAIKQSKEGDKAPKTDEEIQQEKEGEQASKEEAERIAKMEEDEKKGANK